MSEQNEPRPCLQHPGKECPIPERGGSVKPGKQDKPLACWRNSLTGKLEVRKPIGELLCEVEVVTGVQVEEALDIQRKQGGKLVETLVRLGYMDWDVFLHFLSNTMRTPSIKLANCNLLRDVLKLLPRELAEKHEAIPIDKLSCLLSVGMVCPLDCHAVRAMADHTGLRVKPLLCSVHEFRAAIGKHYRQPQNMAE